MDIENILVIGAGPLGRCVATLAEGATLASRHRPQRWAGRWQALDGANNEQVSVVSANFEQVILCAAPPLARWQTDFEPLVQGVLAGLSGSRKTLVFAGNLYPYGPPRGLLSETSPEAARGPKGKLRRDLDRLVLAAHSPGLSTAVVRASSFYGPEVTRSILGTDAIAGMRAGKAVDALASVDQPHSVTYIDDFARALLNVAAAPDTHGQVWHAPMQTLTLRDLAGRFGERLGVTPRFRVAPPLLVRLHPGMRELRETLYSYERPFVASDAKYAARFEPGTGLGAAVEGTLGWLGIEK